MVLFDNYDLRGSGLINVIPPTEMAKVKIIPTEPVNEADEMFYFNVDFYACQQSKAIPQLILNCNNAKTSCLQRMAALKFKFM